MKRKTAVIHTTPVTIPVIRKLAEKYCGDMEIVNLLDDSMLPEINRAGIITEGGEVPPEYPACACPVHEGGLCLLRLLSQGKGEEFDRIVGERLRSLGERNEVVVLAQASMARAVEGFEREERKRFLTSPDSGVRALGELFV